jgi:membrane protease YdiL (CAAX protease family)
VSDLPDIVWHLAGGGQAPGWVFWAKVGVLAVVAGVTLAARALRPLLPFAGVLLAFYLALGATGLVRGTAAFQGAFNYQGVSFVLGFVALYVLDAVVALAVIAALWAWKRRRQEFFLVKGDVSAPIEPVRWLGIRQGESWRTFGWIFALAAGLGVLIPTALGLRLSAEVLLRALPLLPAVLLFAAVNAFTEEVYFRASFLATLPDVIGRGHALLMTAVFFGLAHYLGGSPPGVVGVAMTGFLAFLLGKAMLETRGMLWAWFIHFVPDVVIFASYAVLFVQK